MKLSLNEGQMTISMEFAATDEKPITVEEVLIGAYDIISRAFSQEEVIRAYYRTDPDTMDLRANPEYPAQVQRILERDTCAGHLSDADQLARHDLRMPYDSVLIRCPS